MSDAMLERKLRQVPEEYFGRISLFLDGLLRGKKRNVFSPPIDEFFALAGAEHFNSAGEKWTREELHKRR